MLAGRGGKRRCNGSANPRTHAVSNFFLIIVGVRRTLNLMHRTPIEKPAYRGGGGGGLPGGGG
jgi:hypothetical protein